MRNKYRGSCHCGHVEFEVTADIDHVRVCDCSICKKRGALNFRVPEEDFRLLTKLESMSLYEWGTRTAKDYFCPICGILAFRRPRALTADEIRQGVSMFSGWSVNVRCLAGIEAVNLPQKIVRGAEL